MRPKLENLGNILATFNREAGLPIADQAIYLEPTTPQNYNLVQSPGHHIIVSGNTREVYDYLFAMIEGVRIMKRAQEGKK